MDDLPPPTLFYWTPKPGSGLSLDLSTWSTNCGPHPSWDVAPYWNADEVRAILAAQADKPAPTDAQVLAAARKMNALQAESCEVDAEDSWKIYSDEFKRDARDVLAAAQAAPCADK